MRRVNLSLWVGLVLVGLVAVVGVFGRALAPADPLKENFIVQDERTGRFVKPPYAPLQLAQFPLGSDEFGRDLLSRVLAGVAPTLTLVLVAAAARVLIGLVVGVYSGWDTGWPGRVLSQITGLAVAVPTLFVALCVIAATGQAWGANAVILGLTLTGWAETARLIREQTVLIKGQPYIEAARALGGNDVHLVGRHVVPQVMTLLWSLLAFEASAALLTTAALGFLGYFINAIWIPIGDFSGIRATGQPELAQMLALSNALALRSNPWPVVVAGSAIALMVLGFNLLGDGLRLEFSPEVRRTGRVRQTLGRALTALADRFFDPLSPFRQAVPTYGPLAVLVLGMVLGGYGLWQGVRGPTVQNNIRIPGDHAWAGAYRDMQGTLWSPDPGPANPAVQWAYTFTQPTLVAGPLAAADGTLYVVSRAPALLALNADGAVRWQADLPAATFGQPALGASGDVYLVEAQGGLMAVTAAGQVRWTVPGVRRGTPLAGPVTDFAETIYYPTELAIRAVTLDGLLKWEAPLPTYSYATAAIRLTSDGRYLLYEDTLLDAATGAPVLAETREPLDAYFIGVDDQIYLRQQFSIFGVTFADTSAAQLTERVTWDGRTLALGFRFPRLSGITTTGRSWIYYDSGFEFPRLIWLDEASNALTPLDYPYRTNSLLVGVDSADTAYMCGLPQAQGNTRPTLECRANAPGNNTALWRLSLPEASPLVGGALLNNRLVVVTALGVYVLE